MAQILIKKKNRPLSDGSKISQSRVGVLTGQFFPKKHGNKINWI